MTIKHFTQRSQAIHFINGIEQYFDLKCTLISVKKDDTIFVEIATNIESENTLIDFFYLGFIHNQENN